MKLVWTKKARRRMGEILDYIEREFGNTSRQSFRTKGAGNQGQELERFSINQAN